MKKNLVETEAEKFGVKIIKEREVIIKKADLDFIKKNIVLGDIYSDKKGLEFKIYFKKLLNLQRYYGASNIERIKIETTIRKAIKGILFGEITQKCHIVYVVETSEKDHVLNFSQALRVIDSVVLGRNIELAQSRTIIKKKIDKNFSIIKINIIFAKKLN